MKLLSKTQMNDLFEKFTPTNGNIIAETACGHEGDTKKLKKLIDCVVESGCQIIKFQIFKTFERAIKGHKEWDIFSKLELNDKQWEEYVAYAKNKGLYVFADVYGHESFSLAEKLNVDGYKIHSEDLLNTQFILEVCQSNKIVFIGVGGAKRKEIVELVNEIINHQPLSKIVLMTGVQTFPTPIDAHSINEVTDLIDKYGKFNIKLGFSDHVDGSLQEAFTLPIMAFTAGAGIVEKHITLDRKDKWIDYHSALSFNDFKIFIKQIKLLCSLLKNVGGMNDYEKSYRKMFKKSPAFSNNFDKGYILKKDDITFIKDVENSIPVSSHNLIGKKLSADVKKNQLIRANLVETKIGAIIVARCNSSRLPNKAITKINGKESIALVIDRIKRCKEINQIILATTKEKIDDQLVEIAIREGIEYYRGPTENVALRYAESVEAFNLDHFVRITGDATLCDNEMIDKAIISHLSTSCDVTFMKNMPFGTHKEIVSAGTIKTIIENASIPENTEYLEYYLENDRNFNINYISSEYSFDKNLRMTLDYKEDLDFFTKMYTHFNEINPNFSLGDAIDWLNKNGDVSNINSKMTQKNPGNLNLDISLKI